MQWNLITNTFKVCIIREKQWKSKTSDNVEENIVLKRLF